jgi:hypothetical protein
MLELLQKSKSEYMYVRNLYLNIFQHIFLFSPILLIHLIDNVIGINRN